MAATLTWAQDHGAATGSPAHGTTRDGFGADTNFPTQNNWKTADDTNATANTSAPITAPGCSYEKFTYAKFSGTFSRLYNCRWTAHAMPTCPFFGVDPLVDPTAPADPLSRLVGTVTSTYTTPSTTANAALTTDFSEQVWAYRGLPVKFSTIGPEGASPTDEATSSPVYTQYLVSQVQIDAGATDPVGNAFTFGIDTVLVWEEED